MTDRNLPSIFFPYQDFLEKFLYSFVYYPTTNWQGAFSPQFYFGSNLEDVAVERYVLGQVGSYGKQLARILDVLDVLVARLPTDSLTPQEQETVRRFRELAQRADKAVSDVRGPRERDLTRSDVQRVASGLQALQTANPELYRELLAELTRSLPEVAVNGREV